MSDSIFEATFDVDRYYGNAAGTSSLHDIFSSLGEPTDAQSPADVQSASQSPNMTDGYTSTSSNTNSLNQTDSAEQTSDTSNGSSGAGKKHPRFSKAARSVLRVWFNAHIDNPYPSNEERGELEQKTGLQRSQISLWFANARRKERSRHRVSKTTLTSGPEASMSTNGSIPVQASVPTTLQDYLSMPPPPVPPHVSDVSEIENMFELMNPFERWRADVSLDHEPATASALASAISQEPGHLMQSSSMGNLSGYPEHPLEVETTISTCDSDAFWAQSTTSFSTGMTSISGGCQSGDISSWPSYAEALAPEPVEGVHRRRCKSQRKSKPKSKPGKFHCTFCTDKSFSTKHDWQRHEKSQHMCLESWACCSFGGVTATPEGPTCAFCGLLDPQPEHLESHQFSVCQQKLLAERTFYRKDHFQQHLKLVHESKYHDRMDIWKAEIHSVHSVCGFCNLEMTTWKDRCDHLTAHFKSGATMDQWHGELGLQTPGSGFMATAAIQVDLESI